MERQPSVYRLDPDTGAVLDTIEVDRPSALAADVAGNLYVFDDQVVFNSNDPRTHETRVLEFNSSGEKVATLFEGEYPGNYGTVGEGTFGLATSSACGIEGSDLFVSSYTYYDSYVKLYGPPPDPTICPPPAVPPTIASQYATSVSTDSATLKAQVNPHFWPDTRYYVQYGTGKCSEGGCTGEAPAPPGSKLTSATTSQDITTAGVLLQGLEPNTAYHYRFVAQSGGGGPTFGSEKAFATFPLPAAPKADCPNQAFRTGASQRLPDCRAYEMVSPVDKNNGDASALAWFPNDVAAPSGERLTFSALRSFGAPDSAPLISQYLTSRSGAGWSTEAITPPGKTPGLYQPGGPGSAQFKSFSEDLCSGWLLQGSDVALVPGAPPGVPNLYRRDLCGGKPTYELLTSVAPPSFVPNGEGAESQYYPNPQGFSTDGAHTVFRADDPLTPDSCETGRIFQVYETSEGGQLHLVSVLPDGTANCTHASAGLFIEVPNNFQFSSQHHAVSADGSRVFWSAGTGPTSTVPVAGNQGGEVNGARLFVRVNTTEPESAHLHGQATGTGDLIGPAAGTGKTTKGAKSVSELTVTSGAFAVGQEITGSGIPAGTTITKVNSGSLTISQAATATQAGVELTAISSAIVANVKTTTGAFEVGQEIAGSGIAPGTTVAACAPSCGAGATSLTLSAKATGTEAGASLSATSECTEVDRACTRAVSDGGGVFWGAARDGSRALYTTGQLTPVTQPGQAELFEFDVDGNERHLIAEAVKGVIGASDDASRVYFVSTGVLTGEEENDQGEKAEAGKANLYLYEKGVVGLTFVTRLSNFEASPELTSNVSAPASLMPFYRTSRVSPDGEHLAFTSTRSVTGYDNADVSSGRPDAEVYLYDAESGALRCISCNPTGARPIGRAMPSASIDGSAGNNWISARIPGWVNDLHPSRLLSADGDRLFFESYDALVPRDANGKQDVYEWERSASEGGCEEAGAEIYVQSAGGCLSLISSGTSAQDSKFIDASAGGSDVFFSTSASLLVDDLDLIDIYDARVGGGFPPRPEPPAACEGEACQSPPASPDDATPASASFEGAGNVTAEPPVTRKPCAKGKVRRRGRCVKKRHPRRSHQRRANHDRRAAR